jgi:hypothetical protein
MDIVLSEVAARRGFISQEQFGLHDILNNRFGRYYQQGGSSRLSASLVARGQTGRQRQKKRNLQGAA